MLRKTDGDGSRTLLKPEASGVTMASNVLGEPVRALCVRRLLPHSKWTARVWPGVPKKAASLTSTSPPIWSVTRCEGSYASGLETRYSMTTC
jgi:hypothetical protein